MTDSDDNALHEAPIEFMHGATEVTGSCEAQSILPTADGYACHCTCGRWDTVVATQDEGVAAARQHTAEARALDAAAEQAAP
jgi:hypothetical protein